ncbi:LysR family transcriptional regulator [Pokkaliibacter plantistimulans]|uniref:LysR family transcriptional regulator n=1 Tax=Proteobacteria bacterium 228 TaxID=2083153 RepID=A0A2S5KY35_9PROT|nr:DoxX family protein [Pokkaliibacter plantistimulans]PPC79186.1 LysR family transcriptional regulator [Pokkaliibacter plantistimulans]
MATTLTDWGLLFQRLAGSLLVLQVHGLPKLLHFQQQLSLIEDPLGLGASLTLWLAILAEVVCPLLIMLGVFTRLACLPLLFLLLVALLLVHPQWSLAEGQFGWLLLILFGTLLISGSGRLALGQRVAGRFPLLARVS